MKVKLTYVIEQEIVVLDMSPQEYCNLRADFDYGNYFPKKARKRNVKIMDRESEKEIENFFLKRLDK